MQHLLMEGHVRCFSMSNVDLEATMRKTDWIKVARARKASTSIEVVKYDLKSQQLTKSLA